MSRAPKTRVRPDEIGGRGDDRVERGVVTSAASPPARRRRRRWSRFRATPSGCRRRRHDAVVGDRLGASSALWNVADSAPDKVIATMWSEPAAARRRYACSNRPGDGAAVEGSVGDALQRAQNSAMDSSSRSTSSSSPKRIDSGTTSIPRRRDDLLGQIAGAVGDDTDAGAHDRDHLDDLTACNLVPSGHERSSVPASSERSWPEVDSALSANESAVATACVAAIGRQHHGGIARGVELGASRRRRWVYHHDARTRAAPPVTTWLSPLT